MPSRCRIGLVGTILLTFFGHLVFLSARCPLDLAEDEAYYWDWSRQLDISYYSKGPMTACLIRASCAVFGERMVAVRLPALVMGAGLACCIAWLTRRLFGSQRLALGAVLLAHLAPMMIAAGLVITTDPPFLFFWALASCLAVHAAMDGRRWAWIALGGAIGAGLLTKFTMLIWPLGFGLFLLLDRASRQLLRSPWPYVSMGIAATFALPMLVWNARHGWVTFLHVGEDIGVLDGGFALRNAADFWIEQMGVIGPGLFALILAAVVWALWQQWRTLGGRGSRRAAFGEGDAPAEPPLWCRRPACSADGRRDACTTKRPRLGGSLALPADSDCQRGQLYLLCLGLPVFVAVALSSFRHHPAANWTASSYLTLLILAARFIATRLADRRLWRLWRFLVYPAIVSGLLLVLVAHNTEALYPAVAAINVHRPQRPILVRKIDPTHRLHAWREVGAAVSQHVRNLRDPLVMASDYPTAAELAFYVAGQPRTYCIGSYFTDASRREPFSQYDMWPDRRLDPPWLDRNGLRGRDAIYVGPDSPDVRRAFGAVQALPDIVIHRGGIEVRRVQVWRCEGFKGIEWPGWRGKYNK